MTDPDPIVIPIERSYVVAGASWLDERKPNWPFMVNAETLDVMDPRLCMLGQTFERDGVEDGYMNAMRTLDLKTAQWRREHGFLGTDHESGSWLEIKQNYRRLTEEWRRLIYLRRTQATPKPNKVTEMELES